MLNKPFSPSVSVIIVNYNGQEFIGECLDSVLASTYRNFEIVVIDNASTDGSLSYLKKKYGKNKKVRIIKSEKQLYFTGGGNLGAKKAKVEKLFFLNSDTVIDKNCLKELVKFTGKQKKYLVQPKILVYGHRKRSEGSLANARIIDNVGGKYSFWGFGYGLGRGETDHGQYEQNRRLDFVNGTAFMIDRNFFWKLGGFDESFRYFYEDVDLSLRAKRVGGQCWYCAKSLLFHKGSLTFRKNLSKDKLSYYVRRNRMLTLLKNQKQVSLLIKLPIMFIAHFLLSLPFINYFRLLELKLVIKKNRFSLLDLGSGDSSFLKLAEKNNIKVLGVDKVPTNHPKVILSSIEDLKLEKKFEAVTMYHVLEHVQQPKKVLQKVKSFLKKDGFLVIEIPLVGNLTEKFLGEDYLAYQDKTHRHFFTKREIQSLLKKTGFQIIKKGITWYEFPFTIITTGFKKGIFWGILGLLLFFPLKIATLLGLNKEIIRLYLKPSE